MNKKFNQSKTVSAQKCLRAKVTLRPKKCSCNFIFMQFCLLVQFRNLPEIIV